MNLPSFNTLWTEKYRPHTLDDIALSDAVKEQIKGFVSGGAVPNIFLCSRPGQGKTTLARMIAYDLLNADVLYINASEENNVDTVRTNIADFARTLPLPGHTIKVVILDEADGFANVQSQRILRGLMEEASEHTRFILTANYKNRILPAIQSRCLTIDVTPDKKQIVKRCFNILKNEGVQFTKEQIAQSLPQLIKRHYPDVRSIVKILQSSVDENGVLSIKDGVSGNNFAVEVVNAIVTSENPLSVREMILKNEIQFGCDYCTLLTEMYQYVISDECSLTPREKMYFTITICQYVSQFQQVIDPELNCAACIFSLYGFVHK